MRDAPPDYAAEVDAEYLRLFTWPRDYRNSGSRKSKSHFQDLRCRQAWRSPYWRKKWPSGRSLTEKRDQVSRILVERLYWFDDAFLPGDPLAALFFSFGRTDAPAEALEAVNNKPGLNMSLSTIFAGDLTLQKAW